MTALVYSVTRLHASADSFEEELPFQLAVIEHQDQTRTTVRIVGPAVDIGDTVEPEPERPGCWKLLPGDKQQR